MSAERPRWLPRLSSLIALMALVCVSCAVLPAREAAPAPASKATVAAQITVHGAQGALSPVGEARVLAAVQAEGRAEAMAHHLSLLASRGEADLYRGNIARLLVDGPATFAAMKAAITEARALVLLESYIFEDGGIAAEIGELLARRAGEGLTVALIYDSVGSLGADPAFFERLQKAGVAVCAFNPVNPLKRPGYWSIQQRDHRKVLVADNAVAFTGGINISQVYSAGSSGAGSSGSGSSRSFGSGRSDEDKLKSGWRDTQIELRGPVVGAFARAFRGTWQSQGCPGELPEAPAALNATPGTRVVQLLASEPKDGDSRIYKAIIGAIDGAQQSAHLTMAYFAPGPDMIKALCDAARRGVDVVLILPSRSDFTLMLHAGRSYYQQLFEAGVHISEMEHAVLHAKAAVIDGVFSTVGSSNLDWRSFVDNTEINAIVLGDDFGQEMQALFERDLAASVPVDRARWAERGIKPRMLEMIGRVAERWL